MSYHPLVGWDGVHKGGARPRGVHPLASVGGPPEHRQWLVGDPFLEPDIHPTALVNAFCTVDAGMTYRQTTTVGARSFLQARVHLGHNTVVGEDCEICAGVVVGGEVTIGDGVRIGGNSWVKPLVTIGDGAIIGGGSVVTKDVPAHEVWCGSPARLLKVAWTHRDYQAAPVDEDPNVFGRVPAFPPREDAETEETWAMVRPWHHRMRRVAVSGEMVDLT